MAYPTEPKIEIDNLTPHTTLGGYHASWQEGALIAHAWLEAVNEQPALGYELTTSYHTVSGREPGLRQRDQGALLTAKLRERVTKQMIGAGWQPIPSSETGSHMAWQHESRLKPQNPEEHGELVVPKPAPVKADRQAARSARKLDQMIIEHQAKQRAATAQPPEVEQDQISAGLQPGQRVLHVAPREGKRQFKTYNRTLAPTSVTFTCSRCHREATRSQYPGRIPQYCEPCADIVKREKTRERVARLRAGQKSGKKIQKPDIDEDRKQILLRKRGDGTYRIHQVEFDRWTAEVRGLLTRGKWIPLSDEKLRFRLFASIDEAFQAVEANRREMEELQNM